MTHLDTSTNYVLALYTSTTDLGFDSSCTTTQQSVSLTNLTSSTETQSFVVHSCNAGTGVLTVILNGGGFTKNDSASVTPPTLDAPSGLTITPLPLREALLRWDAVVQSGATVTYIVQVQKVGGTWDSDISMTVPEHRIDLEAVASDLGLDDEEAFRFQVKAQDSTGAYLDSAWSTVTIRDSPLLQSLGRAYGESTDNITSGGKAVLQWEEISAVQGYEIRYRKLGHYENKHHSIGSEWLADINVYPENHAYETANVMVTAPSLGVSSATITRLIPRELYAIQLNYQTSTGEWVFSARDVFVWPSNSRPGQDDDFPGQGDRVAGFPYFGHWPDAEYAPVICQNTFPETERSAWVALIKHATEQWEVATTSVITVTPSSADCEDLDSPSPMDILKSVFRLTPQAFITDAIIDALMELVGDVLSWLGDFFGIGSDETQTAARIYMVDTTGWDQVLDYVEVLQNPFSACVYMKRACVISPVGYTIPGQSANLKLGENAYGPFDVAVDMVINEGRSRELRGCLERTFSRLLCDYRHMHTPSLQRRLVQLRRCRQRGPRFDCGHGLRQ